MVKITAICDDELTSAAFKGKDLVLMGKQAPGDGEPSPTRPLRSVTPPPYHPPDKEQQGAVTSLPEHTTHPRKACWDVRPSLKARRTSNPLRNIVDKLRPDPHHNQAPIALTLGDPTVYGNLPCPKPLLDTIMTNLTSQHFSSYGPSSGRLDAREALAQHYTLPNNPLTAEEVIIASGASGALEIAFSGLLNEGDSILVPRPGFTLYHVLAESIGARACGYQLDPDKGFEVDLQDLEAHIDGTTRAIVLNNPSNPCGSVLSRQCLQGLLDIAERSRLPIISDEIYSRIVFSGQQVYPLASLTHTVPILTIGGMAKQCSVPGWRVGWVLIYDPQGVLSEGEVSVVQGLKNLTQLVLGANTLAQSTIPAAFPPHGATTPEALALDHYYHAYNTLLQSNAEFLDRQLQGTPGLTMIRPQGTFYAMVRLDLSRLQGLVDDTDFCHRLVEEENVLVLPGQCFGLRNYVRLVFAPPQDVLAEAVRRIQAFCHRHDATRQVD